MKATAMTCEWLAPEVSVLGTVPPPRLAPPAESGVVRRAQLTRSGWLLSLCPSGGIQPLPGMAPAVGNCARSLSPP